MPMKNPPHPGGVVLRQCIEPLVDNNGRRSGAGSNPYNVVGTGEWKRGIFRRWQYGLPRFWRQCSQLANAQATTI